MDRIRLGGEDLDYHVVGQGEAVVFIHGAFIADAFQPLLDEPALGDRYRLVWYRRRGYSRGNRSRGRLSLAQHASDCHALLSSLGIRTAHVVGHSYGGCVALQLALDFPQLVGSLALLEPGLMVGRSAEGYRAALADGQRRYREMEHPEALLDEFFEARCPGYRRPLEDALPGAFEQAVADAPTWFEREVEGQLGWAFTADALASVVRPTLSVVGGASLQLWDRFGETHQLLLDRVVEAEGAVLQGATHFLHLESRALSTETATTLADFFARHPLPAEQ